MLPPSDQVRFLRRLLTVALGIFFGVVTVNLLVDPWNRFGWNRLGVFVTASRENASTQVERYPHEALLVGNSRTIGLPVARLESPRLFNGAFEGATLVEIRLFLERHLRTQKLVVLNLDPYLLGPESDNPPSAVFGPPTLRSLGGYLASLKALEYSVKTVSDRLAGRPLGYAPDGTMETESWRRQRDVEDPAWQRRQLARESERLAGFRFDPRRTAELADLLALVRGRGAGLVVYLSPVHEDLLPALESGPAGAAWREAVEAVRRTFPRTVDLTRSRFSARTNYFRTDPVHFFPEIGLRLLREDVLGVVPGARGEGPADSLQGRSGQP